ncbi:hypothetical protein ACVW19_004114 [Streptomyces sp. TE5632]
MPRFRRLMRTPRHELHGRLHGAPGSSAGRRLGMPYSVHPSSPEASTTQALACAALSTAIIGV